MLTGLTMGKVFEDQGLRNATRIFRDRNDAGIQLAHFTKERIMLEKPLICAIPAGGIPVALPLAESYQAAMMLGVVRKVKVPQNPEAGFGAMTWDGRLFLNEPLVRRLGLSDREIEAAVQETRKNISERLERFTVGHSFPTISDTSVIITDDGLASGYTMLAAIEAVRGYDPTEVIVAVPTGSDGAVSMISGRADRVVCLNIREGYSYAVADAYRHWHDLSDEEVMEHLRAAKERGIW